MVMLLSVSKQTIPHREIVAGVANCSECTSNKIRTERGSARRYPFGNVNSLLSSSTEFKFYTHYGSISPSKIIQYIRFVFTFAPRVCDVVLLMLFVLIVYIGLLLILSLHSLISFTIYVLLTTCSLSRMVRSTLVNTPSVQSRVVTSR